MDERVTVQKFIYRPPAGLPSIIFEDDHLLAVDKPSGLLSNPGRAPETHDCALSRLVDIKGDLFLVHRLDCDTSGLLLLAKSKGAESHLKKQLQLRQMSKCYEALAEGYLTDQEGVIDQPLGPRPGQPPFQDVSPNGKSAVTRWKVLAQEHNYTRVTLMPETGRTHQLRVHLAWLGHPLLGDGFYGNAGSYSRLCLHARELAFIHPELECPVKLIAPCPF